MLVILELQFLAARSDNSATMSRRTYVEEGGEDEWNTLGDPTYDPNNSEYGASDSPAPRGRRGRGTGGRRGSMGGGRGQHPQGDIITLTPRARGAVSNPRTVVPLQPQTHVTLPHIVPHELHSSNVSRHSHM